MTKEQVDQFYKKITNYLKEGAYDMALSSIDDFSVKVESESHETSLLTLHKNYSFLEKEQKENQNPHKDQWDALFFGLLNLGRSIKEYYYEEYNLQAIYEEEEAAKDAEITKLKKQIEDLKLQRLQDIVPLPNHQAQLSEEYEFGISFPETWIFTKMTNSVNYGSCIDPHDQDVALNIHIDDIREIEVTLEEAYEYSAQNLVAMLNQFKIIKHELLELKGQLASFLIGTSTTPNKTLAIYRVCTPNKKQEKLFTLSFTCLAEEFEIKKQEFDNMVKSFVAL